MEKMTFNVQTISIQLLTHMNFELIMMRQRRSINRDKNILDGVPDGDTGIVSSHS